MNKENPVKQRTYRWLAFFFLILTVASTAFRQQVETLHIFYALAPIVFLLFFITCSLPILKPALTVEQFTLSNVCCGLGGFVYQLDIYWSKLELIGASFLAISVAVIINSIVFLKIDRL